MILAATEEAQDNQLFIPEVMREDAFNQIDSGVYAIVVNEAQQEIWRSFSAVEAHLETASVERFGEFVFDQFEDEWGGYFRLQFGVVWEHEDASESRFGFTIFYDKLLLESVLDDFRYTLRTHILVVLLMMLVILMVALTWGLLPLRKIAQDLQKIETGKQQHLSFDYPQELLPLTENLNLLLEAEKSHRQRYRDTLSNLAHSLKTPLAILKGLNFSNLNTNEQDEQQQELESQIQRMDEIIQYQLYRPTGVHSGHILSSTALLPQIEKLTAALKKVYREKAIVFAIECDDKARFFGDEGDLMELLGNVVDNACKWTSDFVRINVQYSVFDDKHSLTIQIEDNGPGIKPELRESILKRGQRIDEQTEGQGIGLSVVAELVNQYQGTITVAGSELGGALFILNFNFSR